MIRKVVLKGFKRFGEVTFDIPGHMVLAGPNVTGRATLLQTVGLNNVPIEIAAQLKPEEVHPEIIERLSQIKQAFGVANV